jgi:aspartate carbamoyltransferase catalytic subunit
VVGEPLVIESEKSEIVGCVFGVVRRWAREGVAQLAVLFVHCRRLIDAIDGAAQAPTQLDHDRIIFRGTYFGNAS